MKLNAFLLIFVFVAACAHLEQPKLTPLQQEDLSLCLASIDHVVCDGDRVCIADAVQGYVEAKDKQRFLLRHGCPRDIVEAGIVRE